MADQKYGSWEKIFSVWLAVEGRKTSRQSRHEFQMSGGYICHVLYLPITLTFTCVITMTEKQCRDSE